MWRPSMLLTALSFALLLGTVSPAKQKVQLSDSYLPVAMQVIAHLTDQMAFESKDEPVPTKPAKPVNDWQKPTTKPPNSWQKPTTKAPSSWPQKPTQKPISKPPTSWPKPTSKPPYSWPPYTTKAPLSTPTNSWGSWTTNKPYVAMSDDTTASGTKPYSSFYSSEPNPHAFKPSAVSVVSNEMTSGLKPPSSESNPHASAAVPVISHIYSWLTPSLPGSAPSAYKPPFPQLPPPPALGARPPVTGWWMNYGLLIRDWTTPFHRPGYYAPLPPKPHERFREMPKGEYLLPIDPHSQYTVIEPQETRSETLLGLENEEQAVQPLIDPAQDTKLLPPSFQDEDEALRTSDEDSPDPEGNLQYLSSGVQEMIKMANDPNDERLVDVWEGLRGAHNQEITPKGKLSQSNLRLLLLYDLLSREAKRLRLSDYTGFSPEVLRSLTETSSGGARAQLSFALSRMVERKDCEHEYANNRAKEMVLELAKDESKLSSELRYLHPLVYYA